MISRDAATSLGGDRRDTLSRGLRWHRSGEGAGGDAFADGATHAASSLRDARSAGGCTTHTSVRDTGADPSAASHTSASAAASSAPAPATASASGRACAAAANSQPHSAERRWRR